MKSMMRSVGQVLDRLELAVPDQASLHDREPQLDLVEPAGVAGRIVDGRGCSRGGRGTPRPVPWVARLSTMQ
jgi:hypothetical protein